MRYLLTAVLLAMSLAAGIGQAAAQDATPTAADFGNLDYTNVRYYLPFTPDGLAPGLNVSGEVSGTCIEQSLADIGRADAWFCTDASTGDQYDPCFENSFGPIDEQSDLICAESPFSTDVVRFTLTDPLQREKDALAEDVAPQDAAPDQAPPKKGKKDRQDQDMAPAEAAPPPPADVAETAIEPLDIPWAVELANGERCELLTGATAVFAGQRLNYGCESGGYVIGELQRDGAVWLASFLAKDAYASDLVPVAVAWT